VVSENLATAGVPHAEELKLEAYPRISTGNDSTVYIVGEYVAKEYQTLSFAEVERYVALLNAAAEAIPRLRYETRFPIRGVPHTLAAVEAVPVERLTRSASGKPLTLSRFVEAPTLEKLMWRPERFEQYAREQISHPGLRAFGTELNALFREEYPTRVQDEVHYHVCMLSRLLDRELGVDGLYIGKYNAKLRPVDGQPRIELIVTDLAVYIDRVDWRESS
jgi:hypothetical protein